MWIADAGKVRELNDMINVQKREVTLEEMEYLKANQDKVEKDINNSRTGISLDISQQAKEMYQRQFERLKETTKKQEEGFSELGKILEIARRISRGDKVPPTDEKKLIEYSSELYQTSKAAAALHKNEKQKEHDALFDEEENRDLNEKIRQLNSEEGTEDGNLSISSSTQGIVIDVNITGTK